MRNTLPLLALGWLCACAQDLGPPASAVVLTDSAGVVIVSHLVGDEALPTDSFPREPLLTIDSAGDGHSFYRVNAVTPLEGGRIAVGSAGTRFVHVFDRLGALQVSLGGDGDGPGEFRGIMSVFTIPHDSLVVFDSRLGRLTIFATSGAVGRTIDVGRYLPPSRGAQIHPLSGGMALVGVASFGPGSTLGAFRDFASAYRLDPEGDSMAYYGEFPGVQAVRAQRLVGLLPFGAFLCSGVVDDRLVVGVGTEPELREFDPSGGLVRIIRWLDHERTVSEEQVATFVDEQLRSLSPEERTAFGQTLRELPYSPTRPAYHGLVVASDGVIWLGDYPGPVALLPEHPDPPRTWTLIGRDGVRYRAVSTPAGFELHAISGGLAYGVHLDELGVESVRVYEVPVS